MSNNREAMYTGCPILRDADVSGYLKSGAVPAGVAFEAVPPGKVVRRRGFWLKPAYRAHHAATIFLVSTDDASMNVDELAASRDAVMCYFAEGSNQHYLGRVEEGDSGRQLLPILNDQFPAISLSELRFVGRVISAK